MARLARIESELGSAPAFRKKLSYRRSLHSTRIRSVGGTLRTLSATLHAVTLLTASVCRTGQLPDCLNE